MKFPIFSIDTKTNVILPGAAVETYQDHLGSRPGIIVGEGGRGRKVGFLPVVGAEPGDRIVAASLHRTETGQPYLVAAGVPTTDKAALLVVLADYGFRGSNSIHGEFVEWRCQYCGKVETTEPQSEWCDCGRRILDVEFRPLMVLVKGIIADGEAGRMASGEQAVILVRRGEKVYVDRSGRLYGRPARLVYWFNGEIVQHRSDHEFKPYFF